MQFFKKIDRYKITSYIFFLMFGLLTALITLTINYKVGHIDIKKEIKKSIENEVNEKLEKLRVFINIGEKSLNAILINPIFKEYLFEIEQGKHKGLNDTSQLFKNVVSLIQAISMENANYLQVRFIDLNGQEKIKIMRKNFDTSPIILKHNELQNKSHRYYFKETMRLTSGQYYYSKLDLNIENNILEIPIKPTIRIGTPVYKDSQLLGLLILNLDLEIFLKRLMISAFNKLYLIDKNGEILVSSQERLNWSHYLNKKDKIQNILKNGEIILSGNRIPEDNIYIYELNNIIPNNENLKLVISPKDEILEKLFQQNIENGLYISIIVFLIAIPLAYITSIFPSKLHEKLKNYVEELKEKSEIIDKYVIYSTTDHYGRIEFASKAFLDKTEFHAYEILGHKHSLLRNPEQTKEFYNELWKTILKGEIWKGEIKNLTKGQKEIWFEETIIPRTNEEGKVIGFTSIASDITDKKRIELLSITDPLTQIYNRLNLYEVLEKEVYTANRYNSQLSVILMDIDKFKLVNDTYGHQVGDSVLVELSNLVMNSVRKSDIFGRWGGEEFLLILPQTDLKNAILFAEKLRKKVENFDFSVIGTKTASFGVASFQTKDSEDSLVKRADELLYQAKENGRNRVESVLNKTSKKDKNCSEED